MSTASMRDSSTAAKIARQAHDENFSSRRGGGLLRDEKESPIGFYIYDNNPFRDVDARPLIYAELVAFLGLHGCVLLSEGAYPAPAEGGEQPGYTTSLVFRCADAVRVYALACDRLRSIISRMVKHGTTAVGEA